MFQKYKKYKVTAVVVICIILTIAFLTRFQFQSVNDYERQQKSQSISSEQLSEEQNTETNQIDSFHNINQSQSTDSNNENNNNESDNENNNNIDSELENQSAENNKSDNIIVEDKSDINSEQSAGNPDGADQSGQLGQNNSNQLNGNGNSSNSNSDKGQNNNSNTAQSVSCSIEVLCNKAVPFRDKINNPGIVNAIPESGVILNKVTLQVSNGTSAMQLLSQAAAQNGILLNIKDGTYVSSIGGLAEKNVTASSGWTYRVNETFINMGAADYILRDGDTVSWRYVCSYSDYWG